MYTFEDADKVVLVLRGGEVVKGTIKRRGPRSLLLQKRRGLFKMNFEVVPIEYSRIVGGKIKRGWF